jgi:ankyrin repeat protein
VQAGLTSLFTASMNGHLDVVRLLLDSKADANLADQVPHGAISSRQ